jgi:hypothetical protein
VPEPRSARTWRERIALSTWGEIRNDESILLSSVRVDILSLVMVYKYKLALDTVCLHYHLVVNPLKQFSPSGLADSRLSPSALQFEQACDSLCGKTPVRSTLEIPARIFPFVLSSTMRGRFEPSRFDIIPLGLFPLPLSLFERGLQVISLCDPTFFVRPLIWSQARIRRSNDTDEVGREFVQLDRPLSESVVLIRVRWPRLRHAPIISSGKI